MNIKKLCAPLSEQEIVENWEKTDKVYISLVCITYNHEKYIKDCIDSFLAQKVDCKFEIIIHDDLSTDKTRDILITYKNKYPSIIKLVLQEENQYSKGNKSAPIAVSHASGDYIAICEGDDYWIDEYKIQKQYEILKNNDEYGFVITNINILDDEKNSIDYNFFNRENISKLLRLDEFILSKGFVAPCSWFMRKEFSTYPKTNCPDGSFCWFVDVLSKTKVYYLDDVTTVYRVLAESASHSKDINNHINREKNIFSQQIKFVKKFNLKRKIEFYIKFNHIKHLSKVFIKNDIRDHDYMPTVYDGYPVLKLFSYLLNSRYMTYIIRNI
ncbi:TPA: glycosyltransferase [Photobacterium damselae]